MEAVIVSVMTFFSTLLGGLAAARFRNVFGLLAAFAAGVLIAVPLFDLLPEALTLAAGAKIPPRRVMYVVVVIAHDFSDGMNTVTIMLHAGNSLRSSLAMLLIDAVAPVLGAVATLFIAAPEWILAYLLPFFAGGFLYLGASDLLPEAHEKNPPLTALLSTLAGFVLIFVVVHALEG